MVLDFWTIASAVLGLIAVVAGGFLVVVKGKLSKVVALGKEVVDLVEAFSSAINDNSVTPEEVAAIKVELQSVKDAFKLLVSKA